MSQKELSDWIEDWNASLSATDEAGHHMSIVKAIAAVRTITIKADRATEQLASENRLALRQLGVAGLLWFQAMMATMATWPDGFFSAMAGGRTF